jgi:hypothetical protein
MLSKSTLTNLLTAVKTNLASALLIALMFQSIFSVGCAGGAPSGSASNAQKQAVTSGTTAGNLAIAPATTPSQPAQTDSTFKVVQLDGYFLQGSIAVTDGEFSSVANLPGDVAQGQSEPTQLSADDVLYMVQSICDEHASSVIVNDDLAQHVKVATWNQSSGDVRKTAFVQISKGESDDMFTVACGALSM